MLLRRYFPTFGRIRRTLTGSIARRFYGATFLLLFVIAAVLHVRSYLVMRRSEAVILGLSRLHIDQTTEEEVLRTVPYLARANSDRLINRNVELGNVDGGGERTYYVRFSNQENWMKFENYAWRVSNVVSTRDRPPKSWVFTIADLLGYRYIGFSARVILFDGKVSSVGYGIANELVFPQVIGNLVSVESHHGYWAPHQRGFEVSSTDDESPQFRIRGDAAHVVVSFSPEASPELRSHAFQVNLNCFWGLSACRDASQIAPSLWQDKDAIEAAAIARLKSDNPCPDRILAGRARYLPDLNVVVLQSTGFSLESGFEEGLRVDEMRTRYKLVAVLQGHATNSWKPEGDNLTVLYPGDYTYTRRLPNTSLRWVKAGDKVMAFPDFSFDSCPVVAATPSALLAVRSAEPARRRAEDELVGSLQ